MNSKDKELLNFINELDKRGLLTKSIEEFDYEKVIWEYNAALREQQPEQPLTNL